MAATSNRTTRLMILGAATGLAGLAAVAMAAHGQDGPGLEDQQRPAFAERGRRAGPRPMTGRGMPMMAELRGLDLTDEQRSRIREVVRAHEPGLEALAARMAPIRGALDAAVTAESLDEGLIRHHSAELAAVEADATVTRARIRAEVLAVLTPEQRQDARERRAERARRLEQRRARRAGNGS